MAGRFPLFFDACVRQQIIDGLALREWDVQRAIDLFPEGTEDDILFEYAVINSRTFVTTDEDIPAIGEEWLRRERPFAGLIYWPPEHHRRMSDGDIIRKIENLAEQDAAFAYPIVRIKPDSNAPLERFFLGALVLLRDRQLLKVSSYATETKLEGLRSEHLTPRWTKQGAPLRIHPGNTVANRELLRRAILAAAANSDEAEPRGDNGRGGVYPLRFPVETPKGSAVVLTAWNVRHGEDFLA